MLWDSNKCKCVLQEEKPLAGTEGNDDGREVIIGMMKTVRIAMNLMQ